MGSQHHLNVATAVSATLAAAMLLIPDQGRNTGGESVAPPTGQVAAKPAPASRHGGTSKAGDRDRFQIRASAIGSLKPGISRAQGIRALANEWARSDVSTALRWANSLKGPQERWEAFAGILSETTDPVTASRVLEAEGVSLSQLSRISASDFVSMFTVSLARELGHAGALGWIGANMTGIEQSAQISNVIGDAALLDPTLAAKLLNSLPDGKSKDLSILAYIRSASRADPQAAAMELSAHSNPAILKEGAEQLAAAWIQRDASGLRAFLDLSPDSDFKNTLIEATATQMSFSDPKGALAIAEQAGTGRKDELVTTIIRNWARSSPLEAYQNAQALGSPPLKEKLVPTIFESAVTNGRFADAGTIVSSLDESSAKEKLTVRIIEAWSHTRVADCGAWLSSLDPGPSYDAGAETLARKLAVTDLDAAMVWIDTIQNPHNRDKAREVIQTTK